MKPLASALASLTPPEQGKSGFLTVFADMAMVDQFVFSSVWLKSSIYYLKMFCLIRPFVNHSWLSG
jgi:hypothetical protein